MVFVNMDAIHTYVKNVVEKGFATTGTIDATARYAMVVHVSVYTTYISAIAQNVVVVELSAAMVVKNAIVKSVVVEEFANTVVFSVFVNCVSSKFVMNILPSLHVIRSITAHSAKKHVKYVPVK